MLSLVHSIQTHMVISNNIEHILKISLIKWEILIRQCVYKSWLRDEHKSWLRDER